MKKSVLSILLSCVVLSAVATISVLSFSYAWFAQGSETNNEAVDGEIGLRGYYYAGDGSKNSPFEIVNSTHFYNLTRLQNLGVYKEQNYFQIGHDFGGEIGLKCINRYEDGRPIYDDYLSMDNLEGKVILPIGSEATPFTGVFNGNGIPIKNLTVTGYPEDIGVFGYVDYSGYVENLVCDTLTINSLGYTSTKSRDDFTLFSADIDDIFTSTSYFATEAKLTLYRKNGSWDNGTNLKQPVGGPRISAINGENKCNKDNILKDVYLEMTTPSTVGRPFSYSVIVSSGLIVQDPDVNSALGYPSNALAFDLTPLQESVTFNTADKDYHVDTRVSLVASVEVDGNMFSRVVQSYNIEFHSNHDKYNGDGSNGVMYADLYCDYASDAPSNYHHGNNIGFLAGHVNGTMINSYVYNGTFNFNNNEYTPIFTESDTGLIGEIGKNIVNGIDPQIGLNPEGDEGIINFTSIYGKIRDDARAPETVVMGPWEEINIQFYGPIQPKFYSRWLLWSTSDYYHSLYASPDKMPDTIPELVWNPRPQVNDIYYMIPTSRPNSVTDCGTARCKGVTTASATSGSNEWDPSSGTRGQENTKFRSGRDNPNLIGDTGLAHKDTRNPDIYYAYDTDTFYVYNTSYIGEIGSVSSEGPIFCGQGTTTTSTLVNYVSYDRFKKDGISKIVPDLTGEGAPNANVGLVDNIYLDVTNYKAYLKTSSGWTDLEALVSNKNPKETNVIQLEFSEYEDTNYYYINTSDLSLYTHTKSQDSFSLFKKYLRRVVDQNNISRYITGTSTSMPIEHEYNVTASDVDSKKFDSVDFLWNQVIQDEENVDRDLGVFKIITSNNNGAKSDPENYATYEYDNINESRIVNGTPKTKVYFSTAEYDFEKSGTTNPSSYTWNTSAPLRATSLPSYHDLNSFQYPFSRDYDYCFEMDLSQMQQGDTEPYLKNTSSVFLNRYLTSILYDKDHQHLSSDDPRFGFSFKREKAGVQELEYLNSLSSYMPVGSPYNKEKSQFGGKWYPPSTISFSIENHLGANIAVVGKGDDITIFKNNTDSSAKSSIVPKFAMRSKKASSLDAHRYFEYDYQEGTTGTKIKHYGSDMKDEDDLYAHIFFLEEGDYVIGANTGTAQIYFLSVQGQTKGNIGDTGTAYLDKVIDNVDFLTETPTYDAFHEIEGTLKRGNVSFSAVFNEKMAATFYAKRKKYSEGVYYIWFDFSDDGGYFVDSFITYSEIKQRHYIQSVPAPYSDVNVIYRPSS